MALDPNFANAIRQAQARAAFDVPGGGVQGYEDPRMQRPGVALARSMAAMNPSGVSWLAPTALPGYTPPAVGSVPPGRPDAGEFAPHAPGAPTPNFSPPAPPESPAARLIRLLGPNHPIVQHMISNPHAFIHPANPFGSGGAAQHAPGLPVQHPLGIGHVGSAAVM